MPSWTVCRKPLDMKGPDAVNTGAFARNLVIETDQRVAQSPSDCNSIADLLHDFPIVATHWLGLDQGAPNVH